MATRQRTAAFGSALGLALFMAAAAAAQDWINPDGSSASDTAPDTSAGGTADQEQGTLAERDTGADDVVPEPVLEPGAVIPGAVLPPAADLSIPNGHLPPPGTCRIWFLDRPPGHQPSPGSCETLQHQVPPGATLIRG